jgi:hypothetical protein
MALAAQVVAWPEARLHEASGGFMRLPPNDRAIAERSLRPELGPLAQGEGVGQMSKTIQSFRVERLNLSGTPALAVQPTGNDFCGVTGNCDFWIVDLHQQRVLLRAIGVEQFAIDQRAKTGYPDVITRAHASAFEGELIRWQFSEGTYHPATCATEENADPDGKSMQQPKITPHPCSPEDN